MNQQHTPGPYSAPIKELWPVAPKPWVGLTDEDIAEAGQLTVEGPRMLPYAFARAIEQRLKEKNT